MMQQGASAPPFADPKSGALIVDASANQIYNLVQHQERGVFLEIGHHRYQPPLVERW